MKRFFIFSICCLFCLPSFAQYFDTIQLHYDIGAFQLNDNNKQLLDSIAQNFANRKLLIYSYADYLGTENPNQYLSDNRANTAKAYLLAKGVKETQIMACTGLGQVAGKGGATTTGNEANRRTAIFIRKAEVVRTIPKALPAKPLNKVEPQEAGMPIDYANVKVGDTINLKNIQFVNGETTIIEASFPEVDALYRVMRDHPTLKISLEGHVCCCIYPDGYFPDTPDWQLSVQRARKLYNFLIKKGIASQRMSYKGFGRTHPILDNEETIEQGQVNRRVEVRILEK
jgi:outer membrane protein OmpA-like peptidoglycan-associated protein